MVKVLKIASAQLNPTVGDLAGNMAKARNAYWRSKNEDADILVLPELFVIGYPPEDLVLKPAAVVDCRVEVLKFAKLTKNGPAVIFSTPWMYRGKLYSAVLVMQDGKIAERRFKHNLPNYGVFDEMRVFNPGPLPKPVEICGVKIGLPVCEDIWHAGVARHLAERGAEILLSPNGSPYRRTARDERLDVVHERIERAGLPLVYVNQVGGQDELVFDGSSFSMTADDKVRQFLPSFEEAFEIATWTKQGTKSDGEWTCESETNLPQLSQMEADWRAMCLGLGDYVNKNGFKQIILGMSGGVDSAMAAAIAVDALGPERVWCVMMPSQYTSNDSLEDAKSCAQKLGCKYDIIAIPPAVEAFDNMLSEHLEGTTPDTTEENIQSRIRAVTLMALSNKFGPMVVTTGNKSEMAVGYATLYGDMCGGYNPLKDIYKTEVYDLVRWRNENHPEGLLGPAHPIPNRIITKAPSAELRPDQTDQDSLPEYEVLDDILHGLIEQELPVEEILAKGHKPETVRRIQHLLHIAEYKRRQAPPGVKIGSRNFGRDRRYPITNKYRDIVPDQK